MIFFELIFSAAVLFNTNVRVAYAGGNVPNYDSCYSLHKGGANCQNYSDQEPSVRRTGFRMVVINEIMADPTPPNQLPEVEFVEIMNTTDQTIDLTGWTFSDPRSTAVLPELKIGPGQLIILCKSGHEALFSVGSGQSQVLRSGQHLMFPEMRWSCGRQTVSSSIR